MAAQHPIPAHPAPSLSAAATAAKSYATNGASVTPGCQCKPLSAHIIHAARHHGLRRRDLATIAAITDGALVRGLRARWVEGGGRERQCDRKQAEASLGTARLPLWVRVDVVSTSLAARG